MVGTLDQLGLDVGEDVAGIVIGVLDLLDAVVDHLLLEPGDLAAMDEGAQQVLVGIDLVAVDLHLAELPAVAFLDRDGDRHAPFLVLLKGRVRMFGGDLDLGLADQDVLVALAAVEVAQLVEVLLQLRRVVDVFLGDAPDDIGLLGVLHREAHAQPREHRGALERDLADADAVPFVDLEDHPLLVAGQVLHRVARLGEAIALLAVHVLDQDLHPLQLAQAQGIAFVHLDVLGGDLVLDVGLRQALQPLVVDRAQQRPLGDGDDEPHAVRPRERDLDLDVVDQAAVPELLDVAVEQVLVERRADLQPEVEEQGFLGQRFQALEFEAGDLFAGHRRRQLCGGG